MLYGTLFRKGLALFSDQPLIDKPVEVTTNSRTISFTLEQRAREDGSYVVLVVCADDWSARDGAVRVEIHGVNSLDFYIPDSGLLAYVENNSPDALSGWIIDLFREDGRIARSRAAIDGALAPVSHYPRPDLLEFSPDGACTGFRLKVPRDFRDGQQHRFELLLDEVSFYEVPFSVPAMPLPEGNAPAPVAYIAVTPIEAEPVAARPMRKSPAKAKAPTALYLDGWNSGELFGWAAGRQQPAAEDELPIIMLRVAGQDIATIKRDMARPDVDENLGYAFDSKGFRFDPKPLLAFVDHAFRGEDVLALHVADNQGDVAIPRTDFRARDFIARSVGTIAGLTLKDIFFVSDSALELRIGIVEGCDSQLSLYQRDGDGLVPCEQDEIWSALDERWVRIELRSAYRPILLVVTDPQGAFRDADYVPWTSLCRGGMHYAELRAMSSGMPDPQSIRAYSARLLDRWRQTRDAPRLRIAVRASQPTGHEPLLAAPIAEWISRDMASEIIVQANDEERPIFEQMVPGDLKVEAVSDEAIDIALPGDAVPSLGFLIGARAHLDGNRLLAAAYAAQGPLLDDPAWTIALPPLDDWFSAVQPSAGEAFYPRVRGELQGGYPIAAIRRFRTPSSHGPEILYSVMAEFAPVERAAGQNPRITLCLLADEDADRTITFLEGLSQQTLFPSVQLMLSVPEGGLSPRLQGIVDELFAGRGKIVTRMLDESAARARNTMATGRTTETLVFASTSILLYQRDTLAMLVALARQERAGCVGCALVTAGTKGFDRSLVAYQLGGFSFATVPSVVYRSIKSAPSAEPGTLPVIACPDQLFAIDRLLFKQLRGFDDELLDGLDSVIDLGIRAIGRGHSNLSVTGIAAFSLEPIKQGQFDVDLRRYEKRLPLGTISAAGTVIRQIA